MKNKKLLIVTSLVILLPTILGILLWNRLPDRLPTHWGVDGQADGWSGKAFAVFIVPLILLAFQWIVIAVARLDPDSKGKNEKVMNVIAWIFPVMSVGTGLGMYGAVAELDLSVSDLMPILIGVMFIAIGNYLPKCRQNSTLGIKLPWTFANEENWNKTHRIGGITWVASGVAELLAVALDSGVLFLGGLFAAILVPTVYSWLLYRRQVKAGTAGVLPKLSKLAIVLLLGTVLFLIWVLFWGSVEITVEKDVLSIRTEQWDDLTVDLDAIDSVEYRESGVEGSRTWGYGNLRLGLGTFENDEFGSYTRYAYQSCDSCIVIRCDEKVLVVNAPTEAQTRVLYEDILVGIS